MYEYIGKVLVGCAVLTAPMILLGALCSLVGCGL